MHWSILLGLTLLAVGRASGNVLSLNGFHSPEDKYRPKFRYWLPDASVPAESVREDIAAIKQVGAGGFEFLPFYQYGCIGCIEAPTDWRKYGFGTEAFRDIFRVALEATQENGLLMDFAQGANQGAGVPAIPETHGLAMELAYANVTVAAGETFSGTLPLSSQPATPPSLFFIHDLEEFGAQTLIAVTAAQVVAYEPSNINFPLITVGQIIDLTSSVSTNNSLTWTAPLGTSSWRIIAWYERYSNQRSVGPVMNVTDYVQNGSWVVDHFSNKGSRLLTNFLDERVFPDDYTRNLLASVGNYAWEDSMEMQTALWWTSGFQNAFLKRRGYTITQCLPLLITTTNFWGGSVVPYGEAWTAANTSFGDGCNADYRTTLNEGYQEYLSHYETWAHERGIEYSSQPAYNLPLNMQDDISFLDAPEGESLGFEGLIDAYRQFSGAAHVSGIPVVSSECGAIRGAPFQQTQNELLRLVRQGLAGGISMHVLHGYAYSGVYINTTWPSFTTFAYLFTEMWNFHQPSWQHMNDTMWYIARNQYISQIGTPKVDLAFYQYSAPWNPVRQYENSNLETLGYTYDYLSSGVISSDKVVVEGGVLTRDGPAYKALIFSNQTLLTSATATKIKDFAMAGLPIFIVGATNFSSIGMKAGEASEVSSIMDSVVTSGMKNVHTVASADELPDALSKAAILPRLSFSEATSNLYSFWRDQGDIKYVFLYNDGDETQTSEISFSISAVPYFFDAWSGKVSPVPQYSATSTGVKIPITLAANQTKIIGFVSSNNRLSGIPVPETHVIDTSGGVVGFSSSNGTLYAQLSGPASLTLSNGKIQNIAASPPAASNLTSWNIGIQDWHRTSDTFSMDTAIDVHNYTNKPLSSWLDLDSALEGVSGIGTYMTTFSVPTSDSSRLGAILYLGPVTNTIRVWLNGILLPPIDITDAVVDITDYVRPGSNALKVEITTTLFNRIKADGDSTYSVGVTANSQNGQFYMVNPPKVYGLLGPVYVQWVTLEKLEAS